MKSPRFLLLIISVFSIHIVYSEPGDFSHKKRNLPSTLSREDAQRILAEREARGNSGGIINIFKRIITGVDPKDLDKPIERQASSDDERRRTTRTGLSADSPRDRARLRNREKFENRKNNPSTQTKPQKTAEETALGMTPRELQEQTDYVTKDPALLEEVERRAAQTTLEDSQEALKKETQGERTLSSTPKETTIVNLSDAEANLAYQISLVYLQDKLKQVALRQEAPAEKKDGKFKESGTALKNALKNAFEQPVREGVESPDFEANSIGKNYLDLAANQLSLSQIDNDLENSDLKNLVQEAINAGNSLDLENTKLSDQLKPFQKLINSEGFAEKAVKLLGKDATAALVSSVQAAELINENSKLIDSNALQFLGAAYSTGTSIAPPPCVECINDSNANVNTAPSKASQTTSNDTNDWIQEAYSIATQSNFASDSSSSGKSTLIKGRIELEKLISTLKLYSSSGLLNLVKDPQKVSMSHYYKQAVEEAAKVLFRVKQRKDVENPDIKTLTTSANDLFKKIAAIKKPQDMEQGLREFFEVTKYNYIRYLWRRHEPRRYVKLKQATAQIILSRKLALLNIPTFDKATREKAALAYLVRKAFQSLNERKQQELEQKQIQLGLKQLAPIQMLSGKEAQNADAAKSPAPLPLPDPARFPSLSEEESPDISF